MPIYGGAAAKPFITKLNDLKMDVYLRISNELYLKKLIAGGIERVYEIGKDFRNESIDVRHNPEFTAIEYYISYYDYEQMMDFTEDLLLFVLKKVTARQTLKHGTDEIVFKKPFTKILEYKQLVDDKQIILNKILYNNLKIFKKDTDKSETILHSLNPEAVLKRGYTITLRNEEIATIENIKGGDEITTIFKNGKVESRVIKKVENEN